MDFLEIVFKILSLFSSPSAFVKRTKLVEGAIPSSFADTVAKISKEKPKEAAEVVGSAVYEITKLETPSKDEDTIPVATTTVDYPFENRPLN